MDSLDVNVLHTLREWRAADAHALLATVVRTWGSSPRPIGSMLALNEDGRSAGSVSGGCIEDDLIRRYCGGADADALPPSSGPRLLRYGISAEEAFRFGLPCGGTLELLLEFDPPRDSLDALLGQLELGSLVRRTVACDSGEVLLDVAREPAALAFDGVRLSVTLGPAYRLMIIGAGALAEYLATMALFNGFSVTECDPRSEYLASWSVTGVEITSDMPDDAVLAFRPDQRSAVVALSHDPKLDDLALLEALHSAAFYVGAIGSRRNAERRRQRMIEHFDETPASLERLHSPIGIYIGSKTPSEIAVSVMAELLALKNGVRLPPEYAVSLAKDRSLCD